MTTDPAPVEPPAIWAAVGNIKDPCLIGPAGGEPSAGTKHFRAGAKVYVIDAYWGVPETVVVIGQQRSSRRFMCIAMNARHIENARAKLVYSPTVRRLAQKHYGPDRALPTKEDAERLRGLTGLPPRRGEPT